MKCKVLNRPNGLINGAEWPEVGETIDLPDHVADGLVASGVVEVVKAPAKKAESKPDDSEKRPAATKGTESRKA